MLHFKPETTASTETVQSIKKFLLSVMSLANAFETTAEIFYDVPLLGNDCEVIQQVRGIVIAGGISPLDLGFDFSPDCFVSGASNPRRYQVDG